MIALCDESWEQRIFDYIDNDIAKCLYLYIDIKKYGFTASFTKLYAQEAHDGIACLIFCYHTGVHIYSRDMNYKSEEICSLLERLAPSMICGTDEIIRDIANHLNGYAPTFGRIMRCDNLQVTSNCSDIVHVSGDGLLDVAALLCADEGIGGSYSQAEMALQLQERQESAFGRNYAIKGEGHIISHAGTGAELDDIAVISSVVTVPACKGQGLATNILIQLCHDLSAEGKTIYSVVYTPSALRMHEKSGFAYCNGWAKLTKLAKSS